LSKVIKAAKQFYYNNKISKSNNKIVGSELWVSPQNKNYLGYYKNRNMQKPYK